jgi:hypothetical protein
MNSLSSPSKSSLSSSSAAYEAVVTNLSAGAQFTRYSVDKNTSQVVGTPVHVFYEPVEQSKKLGGQNN